MYTESKIYVEYIETEISAGSHPRTVRLAVGALRLFVNLQAEHTERQVEAHVLHYEYAHAGAEIQTHFSDVRTGVARQAVVDTGEQRVAGSERQVHLIEHAEALCTAQAYITVCE